MPVSSKKGTTEVTDYRHDEKRKNAPESGLVTYAKEKRESKHYEYDPHLDPQLVWSGKKEHTSFDIDSVSLHIHERISTQAVLKSVLKRQEWVQTTLNMFAEPELPLDKRIEFYQHDIDWSNRLILGDSLVVMNSLLEKELMAGKVQMIFMDPPYGIDYNSNFQPTIGQRSVKDGSDESLTREPEVIKAYRDTWTLGIHSYLTYLRDRLLLCKNLLTDSGSIFVQISDENIHHVRELMDEIFGRENFCALITFVKISTSADARLQRIADYLIWYAKDKSQVKYRPIYKIKELGEEGATQYVWIESPDGKDVRRMTTAETENPKIIPAGWRVLQMQSLIAQDYYESRSFVYKYDGKTFTPGPNRHWAIDQNGLDKLASMNRLYPIGKSLMYKRYLEDAPFTAMNNIWRDTLMTGFTEPKTYVVQTALRAISRCILMTSDPGDLIFDPTCGSGTSAYAAELYGRRWITCDTSRIALALARQRLLTAALPYYKLLHPEEGVSSGFKYETVPHITLKTLVHGGTNQETLIDRPLPDNTKVRVAGPFTIEAIPAPVIEDPSQTTISTSIAPETTGRPGDPGGDHIADMIELLKKTQTINFANSKSLKLANIRPIAGVNILHAEAEILNGEKVRVAISFGPRYGPVGVKQLEEAIVAAQWEFKMLILAGFSFDPEVQAFIQKNPHPRLTLQLANINPDVIVSDLLKTAKGSQIFTVYGQPDVEIKKLKPNEYQVTLKGIDIYDPISNTTFQSNAENVAAWFLDTDYDGYTFRIAQAFFPKSATAKNPWDKLENALHGVIDAEKMEFLRRTISLPFQLNKNHKIAIKVIDYRGNEVIAVRDLNDRQ